MKKILGVFAIAIAMWSGASFADFVPRIEQLEQADLTELVHGRAWNAYYKRVLTSFGRPGHPVENFTFEEVNIQRDGLAANPIVQISGFRVVDIQVIACHSVQITAEEQTPTGEPGRVLTVLDHRTRTCDDAKPFQWEVQLAGTKIRNFVGNPVPAEPIE